MIWKEPTPHAWLPFNVKFSGSEPADRQRYGVGLPVTEIVLDDATPGLKGNETISSKTGAVRAESETVTRFPFPSVRGMLADT